MRVLFPLLVLLVMVAAFSFKKPADSIARKGPWAISPTKTASSAMAAAGSSNTLLDTDLKKKSFDDLLAQYKGKLVLLDFWASWCAPCRVQLLFEHRLEQKYAQKDVVFLFVSLDQDVARWKKATVSENLSRTRSFLLYDAVNSDLFKSYKIRSIPRCMLIGRDGNMLNDDTPWPYDAKLQQLIDKSLE